MASRRAMISGPTLPIAGRSTRPVSFTRPDSQETAERTEAGQPPRAAALSPATAAARGGPEIRFQLTPGPLQSTPNTKPPPRSIPRPTQPKSLEREPYRTGEPAEDRYSILIELPAELALYLGLFIAYFIALAAFLTLNDFNDREKSLPDIVQPLITRNGGNSTAAAIGLSVITGQVWRVSRFTDSRIFKRLAGPLPETPANLSRGAPRRAFEPARNHLSPLHFCGAGFMTTGELPPGNPGPILTESPVEGRFAIQRYRSDQSPPHRWNSCPADAGTKAPGRFIRRNHDPTR